MREEWKPLVHAGKQNITFAVKVKGGGPGGQKERDEDVRRVLGRGVWRGILVTISCCKTLETLGSLDSLGSLESLESWFT